MIIDKEFHSLIPSLSAEEYTQLEENLKTDGCREPLVTWQGILVDGHNRHEICTRHGIAFKTEEIDLPDRDSVINWIITNQLGRRNISLYDKARLALKLKPAIAEKAKENQGERTDISQNSVKGCQTIDTQKELAKAAGVSHDTIAKVEKIEKLAPSD